MTDQYLRKASLIIGENAGDALDLSELRFSFVVKRGDFQTPNSARIRVYNMNPNTMARVQKEFKRVVLQAGYEGNYGLIFDGTVVQTRRGRTSQVDTHLDITAADGDAAYNFAYVSTTLAAGSTAQDHFNVAAQAMGQHGVGVGYTAGLQSNPLPRGKVLFGMARDALACTARNTGTTWSIQDGKLQVVPETSYMPSEIQEVNSDTGMVGLPVQTQNGVQIRTLLNPNYKIGTLIHLNQGSVQQLEFSLANSAQPQNAFIQTTNPLNADGYYYVMVAEHQGDTRGNDWSTDLICISADPTVIPSEDMQRRSTFGAIGPVPGAVKTNG